MYKSLFRKQMVFEESHKLDCESVLESGWFLFWRNIKISFFESYA